MIGAGGLYELALMILVALTLIITVVIVHWWYAAERARDIDLILRFVERVEQGFFESKKEEKGRMSK